MESSRRSAQFGIMFPPEHTDYKELLDLWRMAEGLGFDSAWGLSLRLAAPTTAATAQTQAVARISTLPFRL